VVNETLFALIDNPRIKPTPLFAAQVKRQALAAKQRKWHFSQAALSGRTPGSGSWA
jgi:hypothetical protein